MNKFKLTNNTKEIFGITLYQIQALKDFSNVSKGDLGGWVEKEENLSQKNNAWVSGDARVSGNAWVSGDARVSGNAEVSGYARVSGDAWVYGNAEVFGDAEVYNNAKVCANLQYIKGWFIGGDDSGKITDITHKTGTDYWKAQYVLGDYEIKEKEEDMIEIDGKKISKATIKEALKDWIN